MSTLRSLSICLALALALVGVTPAATADHGRTAVYQFDDTYWGCRVTLEGTSQGGNWYPWSFVVVAEGLDGGYCGGFVEGDVCTAYGSVEDGFWGWCLLGGGFYLSGTYHYHWCCGTTSLDIHEGLYMEVWTSSSWWYYWGYGGVVAYG